MIEGDVRRDAAHLGRVAAVPDAYSHGDRRILPSQTFLLKWHSPSASCVGMSWF